MATPKLTDRIGNMAGRGASDRSSKKLVIHDDEDNSTTSDSTESTTHSKRPQTSKVRTATTRLSIDLDPNQFKLLKRLGQSMADSLGFARVTNTALFRAALDEIAESQEFRDAVERRVKTHVEK